MLKHIIKFYHANNNGGRYGVRIIPNMYQEFGLIYADINRKLTHMYFRISTGNERSYRWYIWVKPFKVRRW
jgi:hypothetical protein